MLMVVRIYSKRKTKGSDRRNSGGCRETLLLDIVFHNQAITGVTLNPRF